MLISYLYIHNIYFLIKIGEDLLVLDESYLCMYWYKTD